MNATDDTVARAKQALQGLNGQRFEFDTVAQMRAAGAAFDVIPELVAEVEKWQSVAESLDATTPEDLEHEIGVLGGAVEVGKYGYWGMYALEALFDQLGIEPGWVYQPQVFEHIERLKGGAS